MSIRDIVENTRDLIGDEKPIKDNRTFCKECGKIEESEEGKCKVCGSIVEAEEESRWEEALKIARAQYPSGSEEEIKRMAKHTYAKMLSGGKTIGRKDGKLVVGETLLEKVMKEENMVEFGQAYPQHPKIIGFLEDHWDEFLSFKDAMDQLGTVFSVSREDAEQAVAAVEKEMGSIEKMYASKDEPKASKKNEEKEQVQGYCPYCKRDVMLDVIGDDPTTGENLLRCNRCDQEFYESERHQNEKKSKKNEEVDGKGVYRVTKPVDAYYFRWDFPTDIENMDIEAMQREAVDTEALDPDRDTVQYLAFVEEVEGRDGTYILAAQNLSDFADKYQPSDKHLYVIPKDEFNYATEKIVTEKNESVAWKNVVDYAGELRDEEGITSYKEIVRRILDNGEYKKWFDDVYDGNEFDLKHDLEKVVESKELKEQDYITLGTKMSKEDAERLARDKDGEIIPDDEGDEEKFSVIKKTGEGVSI